MIALRTIAIFMIACSAICFTIAFERYYSAVATAKKIADSIDGFEFEAVDMPRVSYVCGFTGVVLAIAGLRLLFESRHRKPKDALLTK